MAEGHGRGRARPRGVRPRAPVGAEAPVAGAPACGPGGARAPLALSFPPTAASDLNAEERAVLIASTKSPISFLSKLGQTISRKRSPKVGAGPAGRLEGGACWARGGACWALGGRAAVGLGPATVTRTVRVPASCVQDKKEKDSDGAGKRRKTSQSEEVRAAGLTRPPGLTPFSSRGAAASGHGRWLSGL